MIVITGGAGFIGSAVAWVCNQHGRDDLLIVDDFIFIYRQNFYTITFYFYCFFYEFFNIFF